MAARGLTLGPSVVAAGTALTLVLFYVTTRQNVDEMRIQREQTARVQHTLDVRSDLDAVLISVSEADTAARSFLMTGEPDTLSSYRATTAALASRVDRIATLTADSESQHDRAVTLKSAVAARVESLNAMIEAGHAGTTDGVATAPVPPAASLDAGRIRTAQAGVG